MKIEYTDQEKFNYYCLMNTQKAFVCIEAGLDFDEIQSAMYGFYDIDGKPMLAGYPSFRKLLIKVARAAADKSLKELEKGRTKNAKRNTKR